jgi:hypothetical protein
MWRPGALVVGRSGRTLECLPFTTKANNPSMTISGDLLARNNIKAIRNAIRKIFHHDIAS